MRLLASHQAVACPACLAARSSFMSLLGLGSVSSHVVHSAPCPVAVVAVQAVEMRRKVGRPAAHAEAQAGRQLWGHMALVCALQW